MYIKLQNDKCLNFLQRGLFIYVMCLNNFNLTISVHEIQLGERRKDKNANTFTPRVTTKRKILNCVFTLIMKNNKIKIFRLSYSEPVLRESDAHWASFTF